MKKLLIILSLAVSLNGDTFAQTVIVNLDGTHSIAIDNGNTATIVNPNGQHTTVIKNGNTSTVTNADGTHATLRYTHLKKEAAFHLKRQPFILIPHSIKLRIQSQKITFSELRGSVLNNSTI